MKTQAKIDCHSNSQNLHPVALMNPLCIFSLTACVLLSLTAHAQPLQPEELYSFSTSASGEQPNELALGPDGAFYGTTARGGVAGYGTVFKITTNGVFTRLASFTGTNGAYPRSRLTLGGDGNFYGTTGWGGEGFVPGFDAYGTVFRLTTNGVLTSLVSFADTNRSPNSGLTLGLDGDFYGVTDGFDGFPTRLSSFFKVTTNGTFTTLSTIGLVLFPRPLALGSDGNFYSTTYDGSARIFRVTPSGDFRDLGYLPPVGQRRNSQGLTLGHDGRLYGTMELSLNPFWTSVFRIETNGAKTFLASYPPGSGTPTTRLTMGADGNFFGGNASGVSQVLTNGTVTPIASVAGEVVGALTFGNDGNLYGVTLSGGSAGLGSLFRLRFPSFPKVIAQPAAQTNVSGTTVSFQVSALGIGPLSYQWRKGENALVDGGNIAGALSSHLTVNNLTPADAGNYSVIVSNPLGSAVSSNATLAVTPTVPLPDAFDTTSLTWTTGGNSAWFGQTNTTHDGGDAGRSGFLTDPTLVYAPSSSWVETRVLGPGALRFWWKVSSESGYDYLQFLANRFNQFGLVDRISGEVDWQQVTFSVEPGIQTLRWTYGKDEFLSVGNDSGWLDQVEFTAIPAPVILVQPSDLWVGVGSNTLFTIVATNAADLPMSYRWFLNQTNPVGNSSPMLLLTNLSTAQLGGYSVVVSNEIGSVTSRVARLEFSYPPIILAEPADTRAAQGATARFTVVATNAAYAPNVPMSYQWFFNQTTPVGISNPTLLISNVGPAQLGGYSVVASTGVGSVTSRVATLELAYPPEIVVSPQSRTNVAGDDVTFTVAVNTDATLPLSYQWRKSPGLPITNITLHAHTCTFTLFNVSTNVTFTNGPGTYRVVITNAANAGSLLVNTTFTLVVLPATAPTAATLAASGLGPDYATLNAQVNPMGAQTVAWFDYGPTAAYGNRTEAVHMGNASNLVAFNQVVTGLLSDTNYHYRVVATNQGGLSLGADLVFETSIAITSPTLSAYELLGNGQFRLRFDAAPGSGFNVLVSSNLIDWIGLGPASETSPGHFEFTDAAAPGHATRFYRLRSP